MTATRKKSIRLFYNGVQAQVELGNRLQAFTYTDSVDESDMISLTVKDRDMNTLNSWLPMKGDSLQAFIVLENWQRSGTKDVFACGTFVADDFNFSGPPVLGSINGVSAPVNSCFKETENTKTWTAATVRLIAAEIAAKYSLQLVYDAPGDIPTTKMEQSTQTDSDFIKNLCGKYGLGIKVYAYRLVIWDYRTYYEREPAIILTPGMITRWSYKSTTQGTYTGARVSYTNPDTKKTIDVIVGTEERMYRSTQKADNEADARLIGEGAILKANRKAVTMQITAPPYFSLAATNTVQLDGFGSLGGKYFIEKVSHSISRAAYSMQVSLSRISGG